MLVNLSPTRRLPIAVIAATALAATSGVAYASGLPAAASDNASAVLQRLGITPGNSDHSAANPSHPANHGAVVSNLARTTTEVGRDKGKAISAIASANGKGHANANSVKTATSGSENHGSQISTLATTTTAKGVDKGATISTAASGGKSKAGQHGKAGDQHGKAGEQHGNPAKPDPPANSNKGGNGGGPQ